MKCAAVLYYRKDFSEGFDMDKNEVKALLMNIFSKAPDNRLPGEGARPIYDRPLIGFGAAEDRLFDDFKNPDIIGPWHMKPVEWLEGAKCVISLFYPFSAEVRDAHRKSQEGIAFEWLWARVEGQALLDSMMEQARQELQALGIRAVVPAIDPRFKAMQGGKGGIQGYAEINENSFGSTWSERHAAYVCGLGTFGLSKGIITEKGMAGRFASLILDLELEADLRPYTGVYDYCSKCGACIRRCPVNAISIEKGKDHNICGPWVDQSKITYAPRYGCGLCQTGVPCEYSRPKV